MHYIGIDVGKQHHVAFTLDEQGQSVGKALKFANDQAGFAQLLSHLGRLIEVKAVGLEATGHY